MEGRDSYSAETTGFQVKAVRIVTPAVVAVAISRKQRPSILYLAPTYDGLLSPVQPSAEPPRLPHFRPVILILSHRRWSPNTRMQKDDGNNLSQYHHDPPTCSDPRETKTRFEVVLVNFASEGSDSYRQDVFIPVPQRLLKTQMERM